MAARVVVAMSGGVDSSVTCALLQEKGYDVIGLNMRLWSKNKSSVSPHSHSHHEKKQTHKEGPPLDESCQREDEADARHVAELLDIPFHVADFQEEFRQQVVQPFMKEYLSGRTPIPCIVCNSQVKFGLLWHHARQLGADYLATGHHARLLSLKDEVHLLRAHDQGKDQSYFLFGLSVELLPHLLFPVGEMTKNSIREYARKRQLPTQNKNESQEICFIPDNNYIRLLEEEMPHCLPGPGNIVDSQGNILGQHPGFFRFTVGQRRGLRLSAPSPRYVLALDATHNQVVIGPREEQLQQGLIATQVNWLLSSPPNEPFVANVQIRSRHRAQPAQILPQPETKTATVLFNEPCGPVAPGQAAVFYHNHRLLGGGWIRKTLPPS